MTAAVAAGAAEPRLVARQEDNNGNNGNNGNANNGNNGNNDNNGNANNGNNNGNAGNNGNAAGSQASPSISSGQPTPTGSQQASGSVSGNATSVSIPMTAAAGGITMLQPPQTGSPSYYKIAPSEYITFKWNMTSLYVTPKSLTVIASCSANGNTYAVGPTTSPYNTISGNATQVVWNPWEWGQVPNQPALEAASYVLSIWDERGPGSIQTGGYLSPYSGTKFGMYSPAAYVPYDQWTCPTCNSALHILSQPAGLSIFVSLIVVLISMIGVLRR